MRLRLSLLLLLAPLACAKQGAVSEKPAGPRQPADVVAIASVGSLVETIGRFASYADAVRPGSGAVLTVPVAATGLATAIGATSLDGIAFDRPLHVIVLDPKKYPRPFLLLARGQAAKLDPGRTGAVQSRADAVLLGEKAAVELCASWAFGELLAEKVAPAPTIRASLRELTRRYRAEIERGKSALRQGAAAASPGIVKLLNVEVDLLLRLAGQTEEIRATIDVGAAEASFEVRLVPAAGSSFEAFNRAQRPAGLQLLSRLPGISDSTMLMAAHYEMGPLHDVLFELMGETVASWAGGVPDAAFRKRWDDMLRHFEGPFAASMGPGLGVSGGLEYLMAVDDGPKTIATMKAFYPWNRPLEMDLFGLMKLRTTTVEGRAVHDGVRIDQMTIQMDLSALPEEEQKMMRGLYGEEMVVLLAGFDRHLAVVAGPKAEEDMRRTIDLVRRGPAGPLSSGSKAVLEQAVGRKASAIMFMNLAGSMAAITGRPVPASSGFTTEFGFADGAATMRMGLPAAHLRDLQAAFAVQPH